jgi:hypothetical protein
MVYPLLAVLLLFAGLAYGQECSGGAPNDICETPSRAATPAAEAAAVKAGKVAAGSPKVDASIYAVMSALEARGRGAQAEGLSELSSDGVRVNNAGEIQVYVILVEFEPAYVSQLEALGLRVEITLPDFRLVQGWLPAGAVDAVAALDFVQQVKPPGYAVPKAVGAATTEGDALLGAATARASFNVTGAGVKVGVISTGVSHLANSVASGDLPGDVQVLKAGTGDEGTGVLEILHDIAPGASLAFYSPTTSADMVAGINALAAGGARVIVDDLTFFDEPKFEDGMIAQAARNFATNGRLYVTAVGNSAPTHYRSAYNQLAGQNFPTGAYPGVHNYAPAGLDIGNTLVIPNGCGVIVILQWNNRFGASADDFDLFLGQNESSNPTILASSMGSQTGTQDPYERVNFINLTGNPITAFIAVSEYKLTSAPSSLILDYFIYEQCGLAPQYVTSGDSVIGHEAVTEVLSVAAVAAATPTQIEPYSSQGPGSVSFPAPEARNVPNIAGVDCVSTRVGQLGFFPLPFCGTSAAAPHVAGIAALLMEKAPALSSDQLRSILTGTAVDLGSAGFDFTFGFGRVDALGALQFVSSGPHLTLGLTLDKHTVVPGDVVHVNISVGNTGIGALQDFYFVILVPPALSTLAGCPNGDAAVFVADAFTSLAVVCAATASPQSYKALYRNAPFPATFPQTTIPDLLVLPWAEGSIPGSYAFAIFTTPPGAFADGVIGPTDVTGLAFDTMVAGP